MFLGTNLEYYNWNRELMTNDDDDEFEDEDEEWEEDEEFEMDESELSI